MADVVLRDVRKSFGTVEVIHGVSVTIPDGHFVVLVGPSGCGKSTLLRMIAGLEAVGAGEIRIGGRSVNDVRPKDRDVAMVFQNYALYPHMTVAENMGFSLRLRRERRAVIDRKVRDAAAILGLEPYLDRLPRELSGGQRQRVAMGRSIVRAPRVFLFDEPLSNLDAQLRVQMRAEIRDLHRRLGTTTVYVTHDQVEAMTMADTIVVLRAGAVEQVGAPLEVYDRPANLFVAGFIGSPAMNVLEAQLLDTPEGWVCRTPAGTRLPLPEGVAPERPGDVWYGVRPEHLALGGGADGLPATVVVAETTGAETHVVLDVEGQRLTGVFRARVRAGSGDGQRIRIDGASVHLFDREHGRRLG